MKIFNFTNFPYNSWNSEKINKIISFSNINSENYLDELEVIDMKFQFPELFNFSEILNNNNSNNENNDFLFNISNKIVNKILELSDKTYEYQVYLLFDNTFSLPLFYFILKFISLSTNNILFNLILENNNNYLNILI